MTTPQPAAPQAATEHGPVPPPPGYQHPGQPGYQGQPFPVSGPASGPTSGYPGQPAYQQGYPPITGAPAGQYGAYGQPGQPGQPQGPYGQPHRRRLGVGAGIGLAAGAVVLSLASAFVGGAVVAAQDDGSQAPAKTVTRVSVPAIDRSSLAQVAAKVQPSVVDISTGQGEGSGIILSADGAIVTNNHVIAEAQGNTVEVTFSNGQTAKATIVGADPIGDTAVIKAQGVSGLTPAKFADSDALLVGDTVLALGSPLGLQGSVTEGIVSALHRIIQPGDSSGTTTSRPIGDAIQTDAAINPGNSGGALANLNGEVVGMNTAILTSGQGEGSIGVGFAIPSNKVKAAADQLLRGEKVAHPWLGVQLGDGAGGALVAAVTSGGPADKAGVRKGDVITAAGQQKTVDANALIATVQSTKPGDQLQLTINRDGSTQKVTVTVGDVPR